jgi:lysozyme
MQPYPDYPSDSTSTFPTIPETETETHHLLHHLLHPKNNPSVHLSGGGHPLNSTLEGIDVSNNNGLINWEQWRGHIDFAEIKATEGLTFDDPVFAENWRHALGLGVVRFAYHFGHPEEDPTRQAAFFTRTVHAQGMRDTDHFVLDLETTGGKSAIEISFWAYVFCREMNRLNPGKRIIVQTFPAFAEEGNCAKLGPWHLWIMDWNVPRPVMPIGPWDNWAFWQYTPGLGMTLDRDRFHGDVQDLHRFVTTTGPEGP